VITGPKTPTDAIEL